MCASGVPVGTLIADQDAQRETSMFRYAQKGLQRRITAFIAHRLDLAQKAPPGQIGKCTNTLRQIVPVRIQKAALQRARAIAGNLQALFEIFAHGLAVRTNLARDGRDAQPLSS